MKPKDQSSPQGASRKKHGESTRTAEYNTWLCIRNRCNNPKHIRYGDYGGRGIAVCARWDEYKNFISDMGRRPSKKHSIDRINNNGSYEPGNCRWATIGEQSSNTRRNRRIQHDGLNLTVREWEQHLNLPRNTISSRLHLKWSTSRALTPKLLKNYPKRKQTKTYV